MTHVLTATLTLPQRTFLALAAHPHAEKALGVTIMSSLALRILWTMEAPLACGI